MQHRQKIHGTIQNTIMSEQKTHSILTITMHDYFSTQLTYVGYDSAGYTFFLTYMEILHENSQEE